MYNKITWFRCLFHLKRFILSIFDDHERFLKDIYDIHEDIVTLQSEIDALKEEVKELKGESQGISIEDDQTVESCKKPTIIVPEGLECVGEPEYSKCLDRDYYKPKHEVTKVDKYYDPQLGIEYTDIEINGDRVSPDEDTVKE